MTNVKKQIIIEYDVIDQTVRIAENDFSTFEAFGVLEAAKVMISQHWCEDDEHETV
jgi:hypothetical protein